MSGHLIQEQNVIKADAASFADAIRTVNVDSLPTLNGVPMTSKKKPRVLNQWPVGECRFELREGGIWHVAPPRGDDCFQEEETFVCGSIEVAARVRDGAGNGWGFLLRWSDDDGNPHQRSIAASDLLGDCSDVRKMLADGGVIFPSTTSPTKRALLGAFIGTSAPAQKATIVRSTGWHDGVFVLPSGCIGDDGEQPVFYQGPESQDAVSSRGTVQQWRDRVASLCVGNSRLVFSVSCAFASAIQHMVSTEGGGINWVGESSSGKSTLVVVGASVFGGKRYVQQWCGTQNGLEALAAKHSGLVLCLDELGQLDPRIAGSTAYQLCNGRSKSRMEKAQSSKSGNEWQVMILSSGEIGLAQHMFEGGKVARAGQQIRLIDLRADAGRGLGSFEHLHGHANGARFSDHLKAVAHANHGAVGRSLIEQVCSDYDAIAKRVKSEVASMVSAWVPSHAEGQIMRVAARFALVAIAGELATAGGLTGWQAGEAIAAAKSLFDEWLQSRETGSANSERAQMIQRVESFLLTNEARFSILGEDTDRPSSAVLNRCGWRRTHVTSNNERTGEFLLLRDVFRGEVCSGFDYKQVQRALRETGQLVTGSDGSGGIRYCVQHRIHGAKVDVYQLRLCANDSVGGGG